MIYIDSSLLNKRFPTLSKLMGMYSSYRNTDIRSRDVRPLMSVCNRILEADPRTQGHMDVRTAAVTGYGWRIVAKDPAAEQQAQDAARRLKKIINTYLDNVVFAPAFGCFVMQLEWSYDPVLGNSWKITKIFDATEIERDGDNVYELQGTSTITKIPLVNDATSANFYVIDLSRKKPILPSIAIHEVMLNENLQNWANFARKLMGLALAQWNEGAAPEEKEMAKNVIATLQTTNYAATSDGINFDFKEFVSGQGSATYKDIKSELEKDIAIAFLGQANTAELPKGSGLAAMQVLNLVRGDILWQDMQRAMNVINDQILVADYRSLKASEDVPYYFEFNIDEEIDREKEVRIVDTALKAGLSLDAAQVYQRIGMKLPEGVEPVIAPKASLF